MAETTCWGGGVRHDWGAPGILSEVSGVIAVAKPAGLATQAPRGLPSVEGWLRQRLQEAGRGGYLGVPHRLDRAVSGVLLFADTPRAARQLSRQFERRQIVKRYLALLPEPAGQPAWRPGEVVEWRDWLAKVADEPRARIVEPGAADGREAITRARLLGPVPGGGGLRSVAALEPLTGRMHQLRVQAAARGRPIVGDLLYGGSADPAWRGDDSRTDAIALHALSIAYRDPESGVTVVVTAPVPVPWPALGHLLP